MKTTNLMFHIFTSALLGMDILVIGLNFLMGLAYMDPDELILAAAWLALFVLACIASIAGGIILSVRADKMKVGTYRVLELMIHIISIVCFAIMIGFVIKSNIYQATHKVRGLSTSYSHISVIDLAGFGLGIAGIVVTISGCRKIKRQSKM